MGRQRLDLTGRRFGDLEALECSGVSSRGASLWRCFCHRCGAECTVEGHRLTDTRRPKTDCGCKTRERRADLSGRTRGGLDVIGVAGRTRAGTTSIFAVAAIAEKKSRNPPRRSAPQRRRKVAAVSGTPPPG